MAELPEPPTSAALEEARQLAKQHAIDIERAQGDIEEAETQLADLIASTRRTIDTMVQRKSALEEKLLQTKAYLSPMRRLPAEMLREIFFWVFEEDSRVAWDLSAVCQSWRAIALGMPRLWSKVRDRGSGVKGDTQICVDPLLHYTACVRGHCATVARARQKPPPRHRDLH